MVRTRLRAENAGIVLPGAAMSLEFVRVSTQRIGLAQISDDPAILGIVDDGKRLLRAAAEAVEGSAQIVARQQKRGGFRCAILYRLGRADAVRCAHRCRIDHAAEAAAVVDDKHLLDTAGREASVELVE